MHIFLQKILLLILEKNFRGRGLKHPNPKPLAPSLCACNKDETYEWNKYYEIIFETIIIPIIRSIGTETRCKLMKVIKRTFSDINIWLFLKKIVLKIIINKYIFIIDLNKLNIFERVMFKNYINNEKHLFTEFKANISLNIELF